MFSGCFVEATDQSATLEAVEGVFTPRSFEPLLQWLYCGFVNISNDQVYRERISAVLESLRFADMAAVEVDEAQLAAQIREPMVRE
ncbi:hypothetical protein BJX96DRAFT_154046 [Aspergillus floccosus]